MPAELFPLAAALSGGRLGPEIALAIIINVGGAIACAAGLRFCLKDVEGVPPGVTAWPWEAAAWGFAPKPAEGGSAEGEAAPGGETAPSSAPAPDAPAAAGAAPPEQRAKAE